MATVKTNVVQTSRDNPDANPAAFLSGASPQTQPVPTSQPAATPPPPAASPTTVPESAVKQEAPPTGQESDPFILIESWQGATTKRSLRGMNVPGGVVLRVSAGAPGMLGEAMCFVPGVRVVDGKIASTTVS